MTKAKVKDHGDAGLLFETPHGDIKVGDTVTGISGGPHVIGAVIPKKNAVAKHQPKKAEPAKIVLASDPAVAMMQMIERAARDPLVDVPKMRELLAMRKELAAEQAERDFSEAMSIAQTGMRAIAADSNNPQTKSRYASYKALDRVMRPIYTAHGFSISFDTAAADTPDAVMVVAIVSRSGHTRKYQIPMTADGKGAKGGDVMTKTHAVGAAITYGQRYLLKMIFNIAVNSGPGKDVPRITDEQAEQIIELAVAVECGEPKLVEHLNKMRNKHSTISKLAELQSVRFDEAVNALRSYGANKKARAEGANK